MEFIKQVFKVFSLNFNPFEKITDHPANTYSFDAADRRSG
jgi:hypothetical protein